MSNVKRDGRYVIREYGYDVFYRRHVSFPKIWLSLSASALEARLRTALPRRNGVLGSASIAAAACLKHEQVTAKKYMSH